MACSCTFFDIYVYQPIVALRYSPTKVEQSLQALLIDQQSSLPFHHAKRVDLIFDIPELNC